MWMLPRRSTEGLEDAMAATGSAGGSAIDPDGDLGYRRLGAGRNEAPVWTIERCRQRSIHQWRANPMARAIVDTYTSFAVGDSGLTLSVTNPKVEKVAREFWDDPKNDVAGRQELLLRSHMLMGETALEMMAGPTTGVTRFSYIDPQCITNVLLDRGNPFWPQAIKVRMGAIGAEEEFAIVQVDELTQRRQGDVMFWPEWRALATDRRGWPFLAPILDWLQAYDDVLWNLIDRTALLRYIAFDVKVDGDQKAIDAFIAARGGTAAPKSGSIEVHNEGVEWKPLQPQTGAFEDKVTTATIMTNIAGGAGLAKTWLAEPEDANRATSLSMAEPVRRRVGGVQNMWLGHMAEMVRFAVDQAVSARMLPDLVEKTGDGSAEKIPAASTVSVNGPEIASADAKVNAEILVSLAAGLAEFQSAGLLGEEAAKRAARKAWEDFVGVPYTSELDDPAADTNKVADYIGDKAPAANGKTPVALNLLSN